MVKYDRELTELRETYENQVELCKKEMQNELHRLTEHQEQLISDEQTRGRTKLQAKEQVQERFVELIEFFTFFLHQELRQQFETEKNDLLAQWKAEINLNKSEQNEINQQLNQIKDSYTKQVIRFCSSCSIETSSSSFNQIDQLKARLEDTENKSSNIEKELAESQVSNKEYKKQIEKLQADLEKQLKSTQQFQVCMNSWSEDKPD